MWWSKKIRRYKKVKSIENGRLFLRTKYFRKVFRLNTVYTPVYVQHVQSTPACKILFHTQSQQGPRRLAKKQMQPKLTSTLMMKPHFKNYKFKNTTPEPKSWPNVECSSLCLFDQLLAQVVWACFLSWTVGMHNRFPYSGVKMIGHAQKAAAKTAWDLIKRQHGTLSSQWNKSIMSHLKGAVRLNSTEPFIKPKQKQPAH